MSVFEFELPLCSHTIFITQFDYQDWVKCQCGISYQKQTLLNYRDALEDLNNANSRLETIRRYAKTQNEQQSDGAPAVAGFDQNQIKIDVAASLAGVSTFAAPVSQGAPVAAAGSSSAPVATKTAVAQKTAPVRVARPKRDLPKLSPQQTLLALAATLIVLSLTIFFSSTWNTLEEWPRAAVAAALVIGTGWGSVASKKYFPLLASFFGGLSVVLFVTALWYAALQHFLGLPREWADTAHSPYTAILLFLATVYSYVMGSKFRIFGWMAAAPITFAAGTFALVAGPIYNTFFSAWLSSSLYLLGILGTALIAKRLAIAEPEPVKPLSTKKAPTEEQQRDFEEANYQADLQKRQRKALKSVTFVARWATVVFAGVSLLPPVIWHLVLVFGNVISALVFGSSDGYIYRGIDSETNWAVLLMLLSAATAVLVRIKFAWFTDKGVAPTGALTATWFTSFGTLAVLLTPALSNRDAPMAAAWLTPLIGGAVLHIAFKKLTDAHPQIHAASIFGAALVAAQSFAGLLGDFAQVTTNLAIWFGVWAIVLFSRVWLTRSSAIARFAMVLGLASTLMPVFGLSSLQGDSLGQLTVVATALAISTAWFALSTFVSQRRLETPIQLPVQLMTVIHAVGIVSLILVGSSLGADQLGSTITLIAFGIVLSLILGWVAGTSRISLNEASRKMLAALAQAWLFSGLAHLVVGHLNSAELPLWIAYSSVVLSLLMFSFKRQASSVLFVSEFVIGSILATSIGLQLNALAALSHLASPLFAFAPALALFWVLRKQLSETDLAKRLSTAHLPIALLAWLLTPMALNVAFPEALLLGVAGSTIALLALSAAFFWVANRDTTFGRVGNFGWLLLLGAALVESMRSGVDFWLLTVIATQVLAILIFKARGSDNATFALPARVVSALVLVLAQVAVLQGEPSGFQLAWREQVLLTSLVLWMLVDGIVGKLVGAQANKSDSRLFTALQVVVGLVALGMPSWAVASGAWTVSVTSPTAAITWSITIGFVSVGALFLGMRLVPAAGAWSHKLLNASLVTFGFGLFAILMAISQLGVTLGDPNSVTLLALIELFGVFGALLLLQSLAKREAVSNLIGSAMALAAIWTFLVARTSFGFIEVFNLSALVVVVLVMWLNSRAAHKLDLDNVWSLLPVLFIAGTMLVIPTATGGWVTLIVSTALALALLLFANLRENLATAPRIALTLSGGVNWVGAIVLEAYTAQGALDYMALLSSALIGATFYILALNQKHKAMFVAALAVTLVTAVSLTSVLNGLIAADVVEVSVLPYAVWVVLGGQLAKRLDLVPEKLQTLALFGAPLAMVALPSTFSAWGYVGQELTTLSPADVTRVVALLVLSAGITVLGIRKGNLGLTTVAGATLVLNLLPNVWFRLGDWFDGRVENEIRAVFFALLVFGLMTLVLKARDIQVSSLVYLGIPTLIALGPALLDSLADVNGGDMSAEDWIRFLIVLGGSMFLLIIGGLRRLAGLFVPGAFGVIVTVVPFAWKPITENSWMLWVILIVAAAILVWVALRLEQFKSGARSASSWMKELK